MTFLKIVHVYLLIGALAGCFFGFFNINSVLPLCVYTAITGYLIFLFFKRSSSMLFNSLVVLFMLQLVSIKTAAFGYLLNIGFGIHIGFKIDTFSVKEFMVSFSSSDFTAVAREQPQMVGINVLAIIILLLLLVTKEKNNMKCRTWFYIPVIVFFSCRPGDLTPKLNVDRDSIDIGTLNFNDSTGLKYVLSNEGDALLAIKSVGTSCGCSKAYFSDSLISPGSTVDLQVGYKATDTGHFKKHIVIETNSNPIYKTLVFTGYVKK